MPQLHLHLGAHKTASTLLQDHLRQHKANLKASGIAYHGPEDIRRNVSSRRQTGGLPSLAVSAATLATGGKNDHLVVLSDENFVGGCRKAFDQELLYPELTTLLSTLREVLPRAPDKIFFSIRQLDSFIVSAFCESLRHVQTFLPFSTYCPANTAFEKLRWSSVLQRIRVIFPASHILVWRFEDLTTALPRAVTLMFNGTEQHITSSLIDARPIRASLSRKAVNLLARVSPPLKGKEYRRMVHTFERLFPKGDDYPALKPKLLSRFDFKSLYSQDLLCIATMDNVSIIT
jgi:hypothetical protein